MGMSKKNATTVKTRKTPRFPPMSRFKNKSMLLQLIDSPGHVMYLDHGGSMKPQNAKA